MVPVARGGIDAKWAGRLLRVFPLPGCLGGLGGAGGGGAADLGEADAEGVEDLVEGPVLVGREVTLGLLLDDGDHVDGVAGQGLCAGERSPPGGQLLLGGGS